MAKKRKPKLSLNDRAATVYQWCRSKGIVDRYTNFLGVFDPWFVMAVNATRARTRLNGTRQCFPSDEPWITRAERIMKHVDKFEVR